MYTVTRQVRWMGNIMVEISDGGFDYVNPDMLSEKYPGEGETFIDPRDAVNAVEASCVPEIKVWAQKEYDALPKCDRCGDILPDDAAEIWQLIGIDDAMFCSENCVDNALDEMFGEED